ncbi:MAG: efflux RND transporter periplasmic adaptor subunit [Roseivivax sp.]|nr:efflux RND transporter periplasmic adaptor subunit [Roseivivax sp.]
MTPRTAEPPKPDWALTGRERKAALAEAQGRKRPRRRWPWVVLLLAALGAGAYVARDRGLLPGAEVTQPEPAATVQPAEQPARAVVMQLLPGEITEVTQTSLRETVRVTGQLDPVRHLGIPAEVAGRIDTVEIKAGDAAQQGDVLVRIDIETLRNQVEQTRATADATRAQLDFARAQLERTRSLVERGVATATNLDSDAANVEQLQASLVALEQQVANAERSLEKATITAPFAGIVAERSVDPGAYVSPGTALLKLVDISALELAAGVPVAYAPRIQTGQAVEISVDGFEGRSFAGTIERIAPVAASGTRILPVYATIDNPDGLLRGGMFASGALILEQADNVIGIPVEALREDAQGQYVLKRESETVVRQPVRVARSWERGRIAQIDEGLLPGDVIVSAALPRLQPGMSIQIVGN